MRLRKALTSVGTTAAAVGMGVCLALTVGACGESQDTVADPAASQNEEIDVQAQLPSLDLNVPTEFQTATFAYG
jgi:hypothetical protein